MAIEKNRFLLLTALVATRAASWTHELTCDMDRSKKVRNDTARRFVENIRGVLDDIEEECRASEQTAPADQAG